MGQILYGGSQAVTIEDRALAHLQVVISTKLRRGESFTLSWHHTDDEPDGRSTIWLSPSIPLRFTFDQTEPIQLNKAWLEELAQSASSSSGIALTVEQIDPGAASS